MAYAIRCSEEKNQLLQATRGICFIEVLDAFVKEKLLADIRHPSKKYVSQRICVVEIENTRIMLRDAVLCYQYLNTSKPVTLRINQLDLIKIKARAKKSHIPHQTPLNTLIYNFAEGEKELQR